MTHRHPYHRQYEHEVWACNRQLAELKKQQDEVAKYLAEPEDDVD